MCLADSTAVVPLIASRGNDACSLAPSGFSEALVAQGLSAPTAMQFAPDGRLFVCEQRGRLRVIKDGVLLPDPFLTLTVNSVGERGLLGVAFDPDFSTNHFVYVYYTATTPTVHNRISRFVANVDVAVAGSETVIFELDNLSSATNHNGGALAFGPDGKLYAAVGENANTANAQSMNNVLGKMLRINKNGTDSERQPVLRHGNRQESRDLGAGTSQSVHVRIQPRRHRDVHQRRGPEQVRGNQRRDRRRQLRVAHHGGTDDRFQIRESEIRVPTTPVVVARSAGVPFTPPSRRSSRRTTCATISLRITAVAGYGSWIPPRGTAS